MSGIAQLRNVAQNFNVIGDEHAKVTTQSEVRADSSNWAGRAVNWIKSKLNIGTAVQANKNMMTGVLRQIRDAEGLGDRYVDIARTSFGSHLREGKPITGRQVAKVISDVIRLKEKETSEAQAKTANIRLNVNSMCAPMCSMEPGAEMRTKLTEHMTAFGMEDQIATLGEGELQQIKDTIKSSVQQKADRDGATPTQDYAKSQVDEACRQFALARVKTGIDTMVATVGGHADTEGALYRAVMSQAEERGIELEMTPEQMGKLANKLSDKLTTGCLFNADNLHPPTLEEAVTKRNEVVKSFLDGLQHLEEQEMEPKHKAALKESIIDSNKMFTKGMIDAAVEMIPHGETMVTAITTGGLNKTQVGEALGRYVEQMGRSINSEVGLREGIAGIDEADTVRDLVMKTSLSLVEVESGDGTEKLNAQTAPKILDELTMPDSGFMGARYDLDRSEVPSHELMMRKVACMDVLAGLGEIAGMSKEQINGMLDVGVGNFSLGFVRAKAGEGVHGIDGMVVHGGFNKEQALTGLGVSIQDDMVKTPSAAAAYSNAPMSLQGKAAHFSEGFLKDFFRNGITIDGEHIPGCGTQDHALMERTLDRLVAKFPSIEEAGRVTRPLFQAVAASITMSLLGDPTTQESMMRVSTSQGSRVSDRLNFSITSLGGGSYNVKAEMGIQKGSRTMQGDRADGCGVVTQIDISITGGNQSVVPPTVDVRDMDFVFGMMHG
ncbi:hypothetical protein [Brevifollis gellanilyticus]|uniref:Uncharacterized protein n=1 Tax=Brevifollis gellanilyticus TaxID=748831 RepID=A0A512MFY6_9BACT|nr:hypothetical protein [Brevifollis gellanilyticus]GEP45647.1 hypothetical protein BGE01nite_49380 [Brevifollis gellanilyticus]